MILLALSLWFVHPAPLDMPRADAYFVNDGRGSSWLEDRYSTLDLWTSQAVLGRWMDDDGRFFTVSKLDTVPPLGNGEMRTRRAYARVRVPMERKDKSFGSLCLQAVAKLAPVVPAEEPVPPRQPVRGLEKALYFEGTNRTAIVCAFLPEKSQAWYLATWELVDGDDIDYSRECFEEGFLAKWNEIGQTELRSEAGAKPAPRARPRVAKDNTEDRVAERGLLRADAHHSVTNYANWHVTDAPEFTVLDDLPADNAFVCTLTNELPVLRRKYAATLPTPVDGTNVLCVARIFKDRDEYLDAVGENMDWTAAYWSTQRRELVAHLPKEGAERLMRTIRHEAFHQYLSYACAMISASPWLNEGYAEYFEDPESADWELGGRTLDFDKLAVFLPEVLKMDYDAFYAGSVHERQLKYRLAWSIAYFLEKGAPEVRFQPFKNLKKSYVDALLKHKDMHLATAAAFGSRENLELFVSEWKKFWQHM